MNGRDECVESGLRLDICVSLVGQTEEGGKERQR